MLNQIQKYKAEFLLREHDRHKFLSTQSRKLLINLLVKFIQDEYRNQPTKDEIIDLCHATIDIFPGLKRENSMIGGIVSIVHH